MNEDNASEERYDDIGEEDSGISLKEFDITATPNDFNVATIYDYIERGTLIIPDFQRNYVWDIKRASKLIESLLLGLPVPQLFLFEEGRNKFLVIDGQQRLMTVYYFKKKRFPRLDKRGELRRIFEDHNGIPDEILYNDDYFQQFRLTLQDKVPGVESPFKGLNYATLGEDQHTLDLRPIRNVVIKQNSPPGDKSAVFEIFNRLNTGGVNLTPQEIRASLFHSAFFDAIRKLNLNPEWRRFQPTIDPDLHLKDVELILRGFAMLVRGESYKPSMVQFLNTFANEAREFPQSQVAHLANVFGEFLRRAKDLDQKAFINEGNNRFNVALFEAVFFATCEPLLGESTFQPLHIDPASVRELADNADFQEAASKASADSANVLARRVLARQTVRFLSD